MASSSSNKLFVFFVCLLFTFSDNLVAGKSDNVKLNLYYETLCPYCQNFIVNDLVKVFDSDLHTITDLKLVPFGNAEFSNNVTVICQHGEEECKLNAIDACIIRTFPDPKVHFGFIRCIEENNGGWESCFKDSTSVKAVNDCYNGDLSKKLILEYGNQTLNLTPKLQYVPWVTLNDKPLYGDYGDFVARICKAYKGKAALPKLCKSSALMSDSSQRKVSKLQVSYANEAINH